MTILGIETSCDETAAAVLTDGRLRSNIISSQLVHRRYGGVVPELASRAHLKLIIPVVEEALRTAGVQRDQIGAIAATSGPGLMGSLLVGVNFARSMAFGLNIPCLGINHMEGHIYANFLQDPVPRFPFLCLTVSGGHTQLVLVHAEFRHELLGETLDDAAGEAFDKVAKMLGLPFPGGPAIDRLASGGNENFVRFPRSMMNEDTLDFSFSGIKTAVLYWLRDSKVRSDRDAEKPDDHLLADLCASFQAAVIDVLVHKTLQAYNRFHVEDVAIAGGVSANSSLRRRMMKSAEERGFRLHIPALEFCTDNAAMIAMTGYKRLQLGNLPRPVPEADPNLQLA